MGFDLSGGFILLCLQARAMPALPASGRGGKLLPAPPAKQLSIRAQDGEGVLSGIFLRVSAALIPLERTKQNSKGLECFVT